MKLKKISLSELSKAELNEREMCNLLGGGDPGCCQCGCNYKDDKGSSVSDNNSANNKNGWTSDPGATTPCDEKPIPTPDPLPTQYDCNCHPNDNTRVVILPHCSG